MGRFTTHKGTAKNTHDYYLADYYNAGKEFSLQWLGKGAQRLGLEGEADSKQFMRLLENRHPLTDQKLSRRNRDDRRNGFDVTFSASKSVSIAFGLNQDMDIVDAIREATNETLEEMERDVMVRIRTGGQKREEKTGNFVAAVAIHPEARAVDGHAPDPQIHAHGFISNHTFANDRWYAADVSNLFRDAQGYYEAGFQSRLANKIQELGYSIERSEHNFEITGIPRELIEKFSKRSGQINARINEKGYLEKLAAKHGVSLTDAKGMVGALTRNKKDQTYSLKELQDLWQAQLRPEEKSLLASVSKLKAEPSAKKPLRVTAKQSVDFALEHGFQNEAVLRERQVLADAMLHGIEGNSLDDIKSELTRRDLVRQGKGEEALLTTKQLQQEELDILNFAKQGIGSVKPIDQEHEIEREWLSDEQKQAVIGLLASPDRFQILRGVAGVGKTTLLEEALPAIAATGKSFAIMAPTNKAKDNLITDGFKQATTVASFLLDEKAQKRVQDGVIVIDESGLIGSPTFNQLIRVAEQQNARIIAVGDANQHQPIERGHPLKMLEKNKVVIPKEVTEIRRQSGKYKDAVSHFSRHNVAQGLAILNEELKCVHEIKDETLHDTLAEAYVDALINHPDDNTLIISPTHAERRKTTDAVRSKLRSNGRLRGEDKEFTTLIRRGNMSVAKQRHAIHYHQGDVVVFHRKAKGGFENGDQLVVDKATNGKLLAKDGREIPLGSAASFSVYQPQTSKFAVGDTILLTRGRKEQPGQKKLTNGGLHTIKSIRGKTVTLDNGEKLGSEFRFWDQGVAVTSHVSQGTTVHRALLANSSLSFAATSPEQAYVSASRAKKRVDVFTDDVQGLLKAASRHRTKQLATDVNKPEKQIQATRQRFGQRFNRIKHIAHGYATKQLKRFSEWIQPGLQMKPELGR